MSLQFVAGSPGSGKSTLVFDRVIRKSMEAPEEKFLVIVPEQFSLETQKTLVTRHPRSGIMNIDVLSFARLGYRVFDETGAALAPALDDLGKVLVLRRILAAQKENLTVLARGSQK
ncbi:MAG: helicase-exonuclease AddAB subunit AddB, partial [Lachnospiraceae bacterium]|nr:helicase-exonuclease AddAB subunit AddB [Lachnospiraceae bacterium]